LSIQRLLAQIAEVRIVAGGAREAGLNGKRRGEQLQSLSSQRRLVFAEQRVDAGGLINGERRSDLDLE